MPFGYFKVVLTGAGIVDTINRAREKGIYIYDACWVGELSIRFRVQIYDYLLLRKLAARQGDEIKISEKYGFYFLARSLLARPILLLSMIALIAISLWLPGRVLFVAIDGNEMLSTHHILQTAEQCGIYFGARREEVRSEVVKNMLLESLPTLQWAGVNTYGCTAIISVREDLSKTEEKINFDASCIVATRDGIIVSLNATSGFPQCKVGDAVTEGQMLVSGRSEYGGIQRVYRSEAEVFANTSRDCCVVIPDMYLKKTENMKMGRKYSLLIGKKRINLSKDSGIYYTCCDKIYREYSVTLPGGFILPISLAVEEYLAYHSEYEILEIPESLLLETADRYVIDQMISGRLLYRSHVCGQGESTVILNADYLCLEMIGREQSEELVFIDGEDN